MPGTGGGTKGWCQYMIHLVNENIMIEGNCKSILFDQFHIQRYLE